MRLFGPYAYGPDHTRIFSKYPIKTTIFASLLCYYFVIKILKTFCIYLSLVCFSWHTCSIFQFHYKKSSRLIMLRVCEFTLNLYIISVHVATCTKLQLVHNIYIDLVYGSNFNAFIQN